MGRPFVSRSAFTALLVVASCSPSGSETDEPGPSDWKPPPGAYLHGQLRRAEGAQLRNTSAPPGAHLQYFGGRIMSNIQVVQVVYGAGNYIPEVLSTGTPSMASFYQGVLNSPYVDWLTEYNTTTQPPPTSTQVLGRGSFSQQVSIAPSSVNNGSVIDDSQIQAELSAQIAAGTLPAPTHDAAGNNNTYYAIFFPHGKTITLGNAASCQVFCAYHGTIANAGGQGEIEYGVHPDFQPGSGCELGCGAAATQFGNYTQVASHELVETMTDPEIGISTVLGPPLAWLDPVFSEIGDICNDQNGHVVGSDGVTYDVQTEFSNSLNDCIVTNPLATPVQINPGSTEVCRGHTTMAGVTLFGGPGRFTSDVTLSLASVSPATAPGALTVTFSPNPVPTPPPAGATATMGIQTSDALAPGSYALTVQAASTSLTSIAPATLVVRAGVPAAPTLLAPVNGADGVTAVASFAWADDQAALYTLDVFDGDGCAGVPLRHLETSATSLTLSPTDALAAFHRYSWRITALSTCGSSPSSACFNFRTASCTDPHEQIANGGFENGLSGWTVDQSVPPPLVNGDNPHTGANAVLLGTLATGATQNGDSQISQTLTLRAGGGSTLSFSEWPLTNDSITFDQQYVRVTPVSPPGATVVLMNEARDDRTYVHREFDLSQFAGMTIKLTFGVHNDIVFGTGMYIDDVSVTSPQCGPPDFVVRVAAPTPTDVCAGSSLVFGVAVDSVNGPNFTSPVTLSAAHLPPGATATFAKNPIAPGESTMMTLSTVRPTAGDHFNIDITGVAVTPPPDGPRTVTTALSVDEAAPTAPEIISPRDGEVNVPRRPTLTWTSPFVPDAAIAGGAAAAGRKPFPWELAAPRAPRISSRAAVALAGGALGAPGVTPFAFGAALYQVEIARDAAFTSIVIDTQVSETEFTVPADLEVATQYFWRVSASNACGSSAFSAAGSFIVGACSEGWNASAAVPIPAGILQMAVVGSPTNRLYLIGGRTGGGVASNSQTWAYDPLAGAWQRKADIPAPGMGSNFGAATRIGNTIYVFGGFSGTPHRRLWRYDIAADTWSRGADLPADNSGSAVAAIDGKIYLAYGTGFLFQTWVYDPVTDTYARKADPPPNPQPFRTHAAVLSGEMHVFGGGFEGSAHVIYDPAADTWRLGPPMPFTATDPAVDVLDGKIIVVGGQPVAHMQIFDPATDSWTQGPVIAGAPTGIDNTSGAVVGGVFHLVGGFDGLTGVTTHWQLHRCQLGGLSSATLVPFVVDGDGTVAGLGNERTTLLINNAVSGNPMSVTCFLYGTSGELLGHDTFQVAPSEIATIADVVRALTHTTGVQNTSGSIAMFGTEVFEAVASLVNNTSGDPAFEDGRPVGGATSGFVSAVGASGYVTHTAFTNASTSTSVLQVLAYPPGGGDTPMSGSVAFVPAHGMVSYPDVVARLGLPASFTGQLSWTASQPMAAIARDATRDRTVSGVAPVHTLADAASSIAIPYVEDTADFSTTLELSNPGPTTANVTVRFVETGDASGGTPGAEATRDIAIAVNSAAPIADIVRWVRRDASGVRSGKHGFLIVTTPQSVTAHARIVDNSNLDPAIPDNATIASGFSPLVLRVDPLPFSPVGAATTPTSRSRFALSNPGSVPATVHLASFASTGGPPTSHTLDVTIAPHGQYFTDNLGAAMGVPAAFIGWVSLQSTAPVSVYNHRRTGSVGTVVPIHGL